MHGGGGLQEDIRGGGIPVFTNKSLMDLVKDIVPQKGHELVNKANIGRRRFQYTRQFRLPPRQPESASTERWVKKKIGILRPDIVHVHQSICVETLVWAKKCGVRGILYTHHNMTGEVSNDSEIRMLNNCIRAAHWVTFVSSAQREDFLHNITYPRDRTSIVYPQTSFAGKLRKDRRVLSPLVLGTMSNLSPVKDPMTLLDALGTLRRDGEDVRLLIAGGDPRWEAVVKEEVQNRGLHDSVRFMGPLETDGQLQTFYDTIDVYVSTSISESFSLAVKEAMDCGVAVVSSDVMPVRELIEDGRTGLVFQRGSPDDLVSKIKFCLRNPAKVSEMGLRSREHAASRFPAAQAASEYRELYEHLVNG
jgi:glycosyltransferase involved in cell wall biosynthesis